MIITCVYTTVNTGNKDHVTIIPPWVTGTSEIDRCAVRRNSSDCRILTQCDGIGEASCSTRGNDKHGIITVQVTIKRPGHIQELLTGDWKCLRPDSQHHHLIDVEWEGELAVLTNPCTPDNMTTHTNYYQSSAEHFSA